MEDRDPEVYKRPKSGEPRRLASNCQGKSPVPILAPVGSTGVYMGESNDPQKWLSVDADGAGI